MGFGASGAPFQRAGSASGRAAACDPHHSLSSTRPSDREVSSRLRNGCLTRFRRCFRKATNANGDDVPGGGARGVPKAGLSHAKVVKPAHATLNVAAGEGAAAPSNPGSSRRWPSSGRAREAAPWNPLGLGPRWRDRVPPRSPVLLRELDRQSDGAERPSYIGR